MKAYLLLALAMVRIYLRDRLTVVMSLALMVFMMVLFGLVMGEEQFNVVLPVAVLDKVQNADSKRAIEAIEKDELLSVVIVHSEAEVKEQIRSASVIVGIAFTQAADADAAAAADAHQSLAIKLITSESSTKWKRIGIDRLDQVLTVTQGATSTRQWFVEATPIAVVKNRYIDFIFPGMLAMAIMQTCLASGVVVLQAKKIGILRRLRLAPINSMQLFGGFITARLLVVVLHLLALGAVAVFGFGAQVLAPWAELLIAVAIGCTTFIALGIMLAVVSPSFESGNLMVQLFSLPMTFLCGVFFKVSTLPVYLAWLPKILPLTYLAELMRGMINLGTPLASFRAELLVLSAWLIGALVVAAIGLRHLQKEEG
jgi:ABC-2 type transport system permease protein